MSMNRWILLVLFVASIPLPVSVATAQRRDRVEARREWRMYNQTPWYSTPAVRQQLKLDDEQYNQLNKAYVEHWTPYNKVYTTLPADISEAERQKRLAEAYGTFNTGVTKSTTQVITDPQIRDRYNQLYLQYRGYDAFNDPTVSQRLKLTEEQQATLAKQRAEWQNQMNTYYNEYTTDPATVKKSWPTTWQTTREQINKTLTPEQQKVWTEMTGKPYDFPAEAYFQGTVDGNNIQGTIKPAPQPQPQK